MAEIEIGWENGTTGGLVSIMVDAETAFGMTDVYPLHSPR